jgi:hypothetical protein
MTIVMRCEDKERLVGYLYDESSSAERQAVEAHLSRCAACAAELDGLRGVRVELASWRPPAIDLGYRVTREPVVAAPIRRGWVLPAWAQAAAAVLVLGAGAGLANLDIQYGSGGVRVRTGRGKATTAVSPIVKTAQPPTSQPGGVTPAELKALEARLREEFADDAHGPAPNPAVAADSHNDLQQVRALVADSEERQRKEFAFRLAQVFRDLEAQRSTDLVHIEQSFRQLEGVTGEQVQGQQQMMDYLRRVSSRP